MNSATAAVIALLMMAPGGFLAVSDAMDAFAEDDCQTLYTYSPTFKSNAQNEEYVRWEFGDGIVLDSRHADNPD